MEIGAGAIKKGDGGTDSHVGPLGLLGMTSRGMGRPPRLPRQRLAKRKARKEELVKFGFCPMTELCSTGTMFGSLMKAPPVLTQGL